MGAESFHADGRTKLIVAFCIFVNAPKILKESKLCAVMKHSSNNKNHSLGCRIVFVPDFGQRPLEVIGALRILILIFRDF